MPDEAAHTVDETPAREATPDERKPRWAWWQWGLLVLGLLVALGGYLEGVNRAATRVNTDVAKGNQKAYLMYGYRLAESGFRYDQERNRMPALPALLALVYREDIEIDTEYFERGKVLCIALSVLCLAVVCGVCWVLLGRAPALVLTLLLAFTLFIFRAAYVQAEVLYYTTSGLVFIGSLALLRRPVWWGALILGVLMGLAHLTKASILPAVGLCTVLLAGRQVLAWWQDGATAAGTGQGRKLGKLAAMLLLVALVPTVYLLTISPYLYNSYQRYGHAFYNVNSTFYIWQNNFRESKAFSTKYRDRAQYPDAPPEEIPSARRYFTTTPPKKIWERLRIGMAEQVENLTTEYGAAKYLAALLALGLVLSVPVHRQWRGTLVRHGWEALYALGFLTGYFLLISFYSAIANGPRFIFALYLPVLFLLCYWVWSLPDLRLKQLPSWLGLRTVVITVMLIMLAEETRENVLGFLTKKYTGT